VKDNFIIHQQAQKYQWSGECFLSVKSFYGGKADYQVKHKYRLTIDNTNKTESFCVFFSPKFVSEVVSELSSSDTQILDFNPRQQNGIRLFEKNYSHQGLVSEILKIGRAKSKLGMSDLEKDEFYYQLLNAIIHQNNKTLQDTNRLSSKKASTRKEIYQRILYVKDFMDSNYSRNLKLKDLAIVGLLSENHLLRNFNQIFGITPFQYISQKRIQEAKRQIMESDKPIKDIALDVGYSSFSNFSSYFKSIVGESPSAIRKGDI